MASTAEVVLFHAWVFSGLQGGKDSLEELLAEIDYMRIEGDFEKILPFAFSLLKMSLRGEEAEQPSASENRKRSPRLRTAFLGLSLSVLCVFLAPVPLAEERLASSNQEPSSMRAALLPEAEREPGSEGVEALIAKRNQLFEVLAADEEWKETNCCRQQSVECQNDTGFWVAIGGHRYSRNFE